ncbi:MAG: phosphonoacetaldehyde hydrolase [Zavarzinella sp.]
MAILTSPIRAVIFDWAGTTVDFGSCGPVSAFIESFRRLKINITVEEAREPMGRGKYDHIEMITRMPRVSAEWERVHGRLPNDTDVKKIYDDFLPVQKDALAQHADIIPGTIETIAWLRERHIGIGSTTGYTTALMSVLCSIVKAAGYAPDNVVCIDDVPAGRPEPWMPLRSAELLGAYPIPAIVAVDDTEVGLIAAKNAGMIAVGVAMSGNALGLSCEDYEKLSTADQFQRREVAYARLHQAKPDFVIDSVADLPQIFPQIEHRFATA